MPRSGRPQKPYETTWGEIVPGLTKCSDGRWRIAATEQRFTEPDERRAVAFFKAWARTQQQGESVTISVPSTEFRNAQAFMDAVGGDVTLVPAYGDEPARVEVEFPEEVIWPWLREKLATKLAYVSERLAMPELLALSRFELPKPSIRLRHLRDLYREHNDSKPDSIRDACNTFDIFLEITGAKTLGDLTVPVLKKYRQAIKKQTSNPGSIGAYFGRVKWIINFGKTEGEDAKEIDSTLSRMAILKTPKDNRVFKPTPITRDDFHTIYSKAGEICPKWQPRLLAMLNLCLHPDEALDLEWGDFDLDAGTFCTTRNKAGKVIRAAVLWPELIADLRKIKRTGQPYVFVSTHGGRYSFKGQWKTWNKLRLAAGLPHLQMDDFRDGAYSAACGSKDVDEKYARLLAGHRSHGIQDAYVVRNPEMVKPASDAVRRVYFG